MNELTKEYISIIISENNKKDELIKELIKGIEEGELNLIDVLEKLKQTGE